MKSLLGIYLADILRGKDILDIGCGYGWCEVAFLKKDPKSITGIEITESDLKTIRENVKDERVSLAVSGATELPFANDSFDTVVSWEVIEHIPQGTEDKMFSEVARVLRRGGSFYLSTPHASFFSNLLDPAWMVAGHRHYSRKRLEGYAKRNGFSVEQVEICGGWWNVFSIVNMYVAKWVFRRKSFFGEYFVRKENDEYNGTKKSGFANIFICFKKI